MFWNKVYEGALGWSAELLKFGARVHLSDPHRLVVFGGNPLRPGVVWFGEPGPGFAVERHGLCDRTGPCPAPPSWRPIALRGAGCVYNDIVDADLDRQVARTAARPKNNLAANGNQST